MKNTTFKHIKMDTSIVFNYAIWNQGEVSVYNVNMSFCRMSKVIRGSN